MRRAYRLLPLGPGRGAGGAGGVGHRLPGAEGDGTGQEGMVWVTERNDGGFDLNLQVEHVDGFRSPALWTLDQKVVGCRRRGADDGKQTQLHFVNLRHLFLSA